MFEILIIIGIFILAVLLYILFVEIFFKRILGQKIFKLNKEEITLEYKLNIGNNIDSFKNKLDSSDNIVTYTRKNIMTPTEFKLYNKIKIDDNYLIVPQVCLNSIIEKETVMKCTDYEIYRTDLFHTIDYAIFSKDYKKLYLLIELNDQSHSKKERIIRDKKVNEICKIADIPLLTIEVDQIEQANNIINNVLKSIN